MNEVLNPEGLTVGKGVIVLDTELSRPVVDKALFENAEKLRYAVGCTWDDEGGYRDWIGEQSVPALLRYLLGFDRIVGFNTIRFDYRVMAGALIREFEAGQANRERVAKAVSDVWDIGERDPEPTMVDTILKMRSVDILMDINKFLHTDRALPWKGRRANLNTVSRAMLGDDGGKLSSRFDGGAEAPKAWMERLCLEVIAYCRRDVYLTARVYRDIVDGKPFKNFGWPKEGVNDFEGKISLILR